MTNTGKKYCVEVCYVIMTMVQLMAAGEFASPVELISTCFFTYSY